MQEGRREGQREEKDTGISMKEEMTHKNILSFINNQKDAN